VDKATARKQLKTLGLPAVQVKAGRRAIVRATASESLDLELLPTNDLVIRRSRPGRNGFQVFEDTIGPDGSKKVVQKAYDAKGNLVHTDPKGGSS